MENELASCITEIILQTTRSDRLSLGHFVPQPYDLLIEQMPIIREPE